MRLKFFLGGDSVPKTKYGRFGKDERLRAMRHADHPDGVVVDPVPMTSTDEVTILYHGLLSNSGADQVYLHRGYGFNNRWYAVDTHRMEKTDYGWVKTFKIQDDSRLNFCFHDSAHNWDNNSGRNWSFEIHDGQEV
jgi:hypothetical protein